MSESSKPTMSPIFAEDFFKECRESNQALSDQAKDLTESLAGITDESQENLQDIRSRMDQYRKRITAKNQDLHELALNCISEWRSEETDVKRNVVVPLMKQTSDDLSELKTDQEHLQSGELEYESRDRNVSLITSYTEDVAARTKRISDRLTARKVSTDLLAKSIRQTCTLEQK